MENSLVSVILPFYNAASTLQAAVISVLNQSYEQIELILLDDGSSDGSLQEVQGIHSEKIRIYSDGQNKGISVRLNQGIEMAKGGFICRMDADDLMFPDRVEKQVELLQKKPELDVLGSFAIAINARTEIVGAINQKVPGNFNELVISGSCMLHPTVMGRRKWFLEHLYNESIKRPEDLELWIRTYQKSSFAVLEFPLLFYRNPGALPRWKYKEAAKNVMLILGMHKDKVSPWLRWKAIAYAKLKYYGYPLLSALNLLGSMQPVPQDKLIGYRKILDEILRSGQMRKDI